MRLSRRSALILGGACLAVPAAAAGVAVGLDHQPDADTVLLWPGVPPGGGGPSGPIVTDPAGSVRNIGLPTMQVFRPKRPTGAAMLVAAGGGYEDIALGRESEPAARWLAARGITAFVLTYRLPDEGWAVGRLAPVQDAHRAMRLIRAGAKRWGIDAERVGALGFSAGGHLMGLTATWPGLSAYDPIDAADRQPIRPRELALLYPVITLLPPYDSTRTRIRMVGLHPSRVLARRWSVQTHVTRSTPSTFMVQAVDDPVSNIDNSRIMAAACNSEDVPLEYRTLPRGGHGFGMGRPGRPTGEWPGWYETWLRARGVIV